MSVTRNNPLEHPGVRELVALSALPAAWRGTPTALIPESVADSLLRSLAAEFVFFRLRVAADGGEVEGIRVARPVTPLVHIDAARNAISAYVTGGEGASPAVVPDPFRDGQTVRLAVQRVGPDAETGVLVAGSERPDFPTELDRLLLEVGANQAAIVLQHRQADESLRHLDQRLPIALGAAEHATDLNEEFITTLSKELLWTAAIVEHSEDAILGKTLDGIVTSWNPGAERLYGYTAAEMVGRPVNVLTPPDRPDEAPAIIERLKRGEAIRDYETQRVTKAGQRVDVSLRISPIRDRSGTLIGASTIARDISDRKRIAEALRLSEAHLKHAQTLSNLGSWEVSIPPAPTDRWSDQTFQILGLNPADGHLYGDEGIRRLVHPDDLARVMDRWSRAVHNQTPFDFESRIVRPDGDVRFVRVVGEASGGEGGTVRVVGTIQDVTEGHRAENELRQAQAQLAHISRVATMGELATSIAHEINQPLAAIVNDGAAGLRWLQRQPLAIDEACDSIRHMIADANRASHVIARIRSLVARTPSVKVPFDPNRLVRETLAFMKGEMARLHVVLHTQLTPSLPEVLGDPVQIQQVLLNIVMNALDAIGGVEDRRRELEVRSMRGGASTVLLAVLDSGVGIAPALRDRIFEPFYTTKSHGLGMGLAISRSIVEEHGGQLWVVPHDGPGTTVQFTIPVAGEES